MRYINRLFTYLLTYRIVSYRIVSYRIVKAYGTIYRMAHKNAPNFAMMLYYSAIEFKQKQIKFFKEQSQLNNMRNYDVISFCFDSEICKRVFGVRRAQNNQ